MGANSWIVCPFCEGTLEKPSTDYREQYGKISADEYQKLQESYDTGMVVWNKTKGAATVGLYHEISITKEGVEFGAWGKCDNCGKEWNVGDCVIGEVV